MSSDINSVKNGSPNFTLAFTQMASFVAIAKTRATSQVLDELIQQCFVILPSEPLSTAGQVAHALHVLFGIPLGIKDVAMAIQRLEKAGNIIDIGNGHLSLNPTVRDAINGRIAAAKSLEKDVKDVWLRQTSAANPTLSGDLLWKSLRDYLAHAFRRHGIQAVKLLDPSVKLAEEDKHGLTAILDGVIAKEFAAPEREKAHEAISRFFLTVGTDRKRAEYIANLADGAFNYFSLAVAPEVSEKLRGKLNELTLFLDTNFLFGILNLHVNPQVDVSTELIDAIRKFKLPFHLRYHEATVREMSNTLYFFRKELTQRSWPQKISRAVVASGALSGIELRYHLKNSEQPVSVDDFLAPYSHWQILLKGKGIDIHNVESSAAHLAARADLEADYKDYLAGIDREKPVEAIQHDMTVLETVRSLRSKARSTLDAGHLFVTCDYHLFRFDHDQCRSLNREFSIVLPSLLWQILRPFISDNEEFDSAFAETFALPEFSLSRGGAQRAAARMASILAGYSDIPEETAAKMLANDLLIAELQTKATDVEFAQTVESALAAENALLVEERAALAVQLEREMRERKEKQSELQIASEKIRTHEQALSEKGQELKDREEKIKSLQALASERETIAKEAVQKAHKESLWKENAERRAAEQEQANMVIKRRASLFSKVAASTICILLVAVFELIIRYYAPWAWLLHHPNGLGLEGCIIAIIIFGVLGLCVKEWRNTLWVAGILGVILVALGIIGDGKPPVP